MKCPVLEKPEDLRPCDAGSIAFDNFEVPTISILAPNSNGDRVLAQLERDYEKNTGRKIDLTFIPMESLESRVVSEHASDSRIFSIYVLDSLQVRSFAQANLIADIGSLMKEVGGIDFEFHELPATSETEENPNLFDKNETIPIPKVHIPVGFLPQTFVKMGMVESKIFAYPFLADTLVTFVDSCELRRLHPECADPTLDHFGRISQTGGYHTLRFGLTDNGIASQALARAFGIDRVEETDQVTDEQRATSEALFGELGDFIFDDLDERFSFRSDPVWSLIENREIELGFDYASEGLVDYGLQGFGYADRCISVAPVLLGFEGLPSYPVSWGLSFAINADADDHHRRAAAEFILFATSDQFAMKLLTQNHLFPTKKCAFEETQYQDFEMGRQKEILRAVYSTLEDPNNVFEFWGYDTITEINRFLTRHISVDQLLESGYVVSSRNHDPQFAVRPARQ